MIARVWHARATTEGFTKYQSFFADNVLPALEALTGFHGATVLHERTLGGHDAEVIVITRWASMDDVRGFAGDDLTRAVVEPGAHACLTWADDRVRHYEIGLEKA